MLGALVIDVVVPARDHAATLPAVLKGLPARDIRSVVVVDRASRGMRDRGAGWDAEMLVRASKLGLTSDELDLPSEATGGRTRLGPHALLHILRHSTLR